MAGLGRRVFAAGEVLTAGNVMGYLQDQAVMNFAGTAARGSAIGTAVSEGMVSYLADSNVVQAYDGSAWNSLAYATAVPTLAQLSWKSVIPTGVTVSSGSGSYDSTSGLVTFTNARDINVAGIFGTTNKHYKLTMDITASNSSEIAGWFTNAGTNIAAGWYGATYQATYNGSASISNTRDNGNGGWVGFCASSGGATSTELRVFHNYSASQAQYTLSTYSRSQGQSAHGGYGTNGTTNGFRISPLTAGITLTGTIRVEVIN